METKHRNEKWYDTFSSTNERGVRSTAGYVCFLPKPNHYTGQDLRYEKELIEYKANAKLIAAAPDLLHAAIYFLENFEKDDPQGMTGEAIFHNFNDAVKKALNGN